MDKPTRAEEYKALGNTFFSQHDIPNALKCYSKAIVFFTQRLNPSQSTYFSNRARAYFEAHRWKEAVGDCEEAIFISLENLKAVILLARAKACMAKELRSAKVTEEAIDDIKLAVYLARQQGNNELAGYAKVVRQKLKVLLDYQRRLEADTERQELKQYYEGVLGDTDDRLLKLGKKCESDDAPEEYMVCPITLDLFSDPVTTSIGHTYEKEILAKSFEVHGAVDPITR